MSLRDYFSNNKIFTGTEKPTQGKFDVGDIIVNIGPNSAEEPMWICVEAGTPGVWELCSGVNEDEITDIIQSNALTAKEYTDGVDIQINGGEIGNMNELQTTDKSSIVAAINELFQSANNGKQLIASAIGEPLNAEDTFSAMSNDINGLLSTFKTNMMNSGVVVEGNDKFKSLIDKIKGLTEGEGNKGIQYAEGSVSQIESGHTFYDSEETISISFNEPLGFTPTYLFLYPVSVKTAGNAMYVGSMLSNVYSVNLVYSSFTLSDITTSNFNIKYTTTDSNETGYCTFFNPNFIAIGVGEEDTTLRDSLASILQDEGVEVTDEDDMASLITKVDNEFNNSISVIPGEEFILETVDIGQVFSYDDSEWYELPTWTDARYHTIRYNGSYRVTVHGTVDSNNGTWVRIKETNNNGNIIQVSDEVKIVYGTDLYNIDIQNVFKGNRLYIEIKSTSLDANISMTNYEVKMTLE